MRKEKRGHARGTDDRGRPRHDGDATGRRDRWKRKRDGRLRGNRGLHDVGMAENRGWASGARAAEKV
jgi:hypothetical protein